MGSGSRGRHPHLTSQSRMMHTRAILRVTLTFSSPTSRRPVLSSHQPTWVEGVRMRERPLLVTAPAGSGSRGRHPQQIFRFGMNSRVDLRAFVTPSSLTFHLPAPSSHRHIWAVRRLVNGNLMTGGTSMIMIPELPLLVTVLVVSGSWGKHPQLISRF
ncbi:hypothetical protein DSECCO2_456140 [anaerobic digester metagenome]